MAHKTAKFQTSYKKQDGVLTVFPGGAFRVEWGPNGGAATVAIDIADVLNLQQTPTTSARASVKFIVQKPAETGSKSYVFVFPNSPDARANQASMTEAFQKAVEDVKSRPKGSSGLLNEASSEASSASFPGSTKFDPQFEDSALLANAELQRSLVNSNPALYQRMREALAEKPESISDTMFRTQFWSARLHLLRAHAVEMEQKPGPYNVLAVVKPKVIDDKMVLNLSTEKIELIFHQYPLVRHIYDQLVPKIPENDFWEGLFQSRLYKKLLGDKWTEADGTNKNIDRFLNHEFLDKDLINLDSAHFPTIIDMTANLNDCERHGNRPDVHMRQSGHDKAPILRTLNQISEKLTSNISLVDGNIYAPIGLNELAWEEMKINDLAGDKADSRIMLKVKDPSQVSGISDTDQSVESKIYTKMAPHKVLAKLQEDVEANMFQTDASMDLEAALGLKKPPKDGSDGPDSKGGRPALASASKALLTEIRKKAQSADCFSKKPAGAEVAPLTSFSKSEIRLTKQVLDPLAATFHTTIDFLHYFWSVFLSGDADKANGLKLLVETLDKSLDRIKAVADTAEEIRKSDLALSRKREAEYYEQTGKRRRFDATGGAGQVNRLLEPTIRAIGHATTEYRNALKGKIDEANGVSGPGASAGPAATVE